MAAFLVYRQIGLRKLKSSSNTDYCRYVALWQDYLEGRALFQAVTVYTEIAGASGNGSLAAAFAFMIACISSKCQGQKSCESTPISIDSDRGSSGKLPWEWP
jgi:hypothetical protein